ncbi:MAG: hypothetical protein F2911_03505 [Actinobacteria bacterium]|nr:hypothetical protein [Actinomycetota bacterium]
MTHQSHRSRRRWFGLRRNAADQHVIDLREKSADPLADDRASVLARLARLRDAGLLTESEYQETRHSILGTDQHKR